MFRPYEFEKTFALVRAHIDASMIHAFGHPQRQYCAIGDSLLDVTDWSTREVVGFQSFGDSASPAKTL